MTTRTFQHALAAALTLCALGALPLPVTAEADSTALPRVVREAGTRPGAPRIPDLRVLPASAPRFSLQRGGRNACDALCAVLVYGFGRDGRADAVRVRKLLVDLTAGYQLSPSHRVSLRPQFKRVRGKEMAGLSVRISGV